MDRFDLLLNEGLPFACKCKIVINYFNSYELKTDFQKICVIIQNNGNKNVIFLILKFI